MSLQLQHACCDGRLILGGLPIREPARRLRPFDAPKETTEPR
jgi:hypothetical protein